MINRAPENITFADGCRGFAAMIRAGALRPEDYEMAAARFDVAADLIDALTKKVWREIINVDEPSP